MTFIESLIFQYDPPSINYHNKPFYVLNDGDHIYLLDDNLHTLKEKMHTDDDTEGGNITYKS